jgi:hypothetical protein
MLNFYAEMQVELANDFLKTRKSVRQLNPGATVLNIPDTTVCLPEGIWSKELNVQKEMLED